MSWCVVPHLFTMPANLVLVVSLLLLFLGVSSCVAIESESNSNSDDREYRNAIVTLVSTHAYVAGALVLGYSLDQVEASGDRIALVVIDDPRSDITSQDIDHLEHVGGWRVRLVESAELRCRVSPDLQRQIEQQAPGLKRYWGTCVKFACWNMTEYHAVLFVDADGIAMNNPDHLFRHVHRPAFRSLAAVPEPCPADRVEPCGKGFQTALLLIRPSTGVFDYLQGFSSQNHAPEGELPLLNHVFSSTWMKLPKHTMVASSHTDRPRFLDDRDVRVDWSQVVTYDFAGPVDYKPWNTYELQKATGNKHVLAKLGEIPRESPLYHNNLYAQWMWNDYYDQILLRIRKQTEQNDEKTNVEL